MRADIVLEYSSDLSLSSGGVVDEVEVDDDEGGMGARRDAFSEPRRCCTKEGLGPPPGALTRCILCALIPAL